MLSCLPVNQRIIIGAIILDLEHAYSRNIPLEVKLDQGWGGRGLSNYYFLLLACLRIPQRQPSHLRPRLGHCGDIWRSGVRLPLCGCVVGEMRKFGNGQIHRLLGLTCRIGGHTGEGTWNTQWLDYYPSWYSLWYTDTVIRSKNIYLSAISNHIYRNSLI